MVGDRVAYATMTGHASGWDINLSLIYFPGHYPVTPRFGVLCGCPVREVIFIHYIDLLYVLNGKAVQGYFSKFCDEQKG